jgi:hypothetical protein
MIKKTWIIVGEITQQDKEWILRSKLDFTPGEQHYIDLVEISTNKHTKFLSKLYPGTIITNSEKEETWLKLYFADRAMLLEYFEEQLFFQYK